MCDTVRCGQTAVFSVYDGDTCSSNAVVGAYTLADKTNTFQLACRPGNASDSPCTSCAGTATSLDGCRWTWTAPNTTIQAVATKPPSSQKCRCTRHTTAPIASWLCPNTASCPALPTASPGQCPSQEYSGSAACWLKLNWQRVLDVQGISGADSLVLGAADRTVRLNRRALECACSAWNLDGKKLVTKAPPAPVAPVTCPAAK